MPQPLIQIFVRALPMNTYGWVKLPYGTVITYFVYLYFAMLGMVRTYGLFHARQIQEH